MEDNLREINAKKVVAAGEAAVGEDRRICAG